MDTLNKSEAIVELNQRLKTLTRDHMVLEDIIDGKLDNCNCFALSIKTIKDNSDCLVKSVIEEQEQIHQEIISILAESETSNTINSNEDADNAYST